MAPPRVGNKTTAGDFEYVKILLSGARTRRGASRSRYRFAELDALDLRRDPARHAQRMNTPLTPVRYIAIGPARVSERVRKIPPNPPRELRRRVELLRFAWMAGASTTPMKNDKSTRAVSPRAISPRFRLHGDAGCWNCSRPLRRGETASANDTQSARGYPWLSASAWRLSLQELSRSSPNRHQV